MKNAPSLHCLTSVWSHRGHLPLVLQALSAQEYAPKTITVVDNASGDGVRTWLSGAYPTVLCLRNFTNQGIARGLNQAIRLTLEHTTQDAEQGYLAFIAPDVVLSADALRICVEFLEMHPECGAVSPVVFVAHARMTEDGETGEIEPTKTIDHAGIEVLRSRLWRWGHRGEESNLLGGEVISPFALSGSCFVIRGSLLASLRLDQEWLDPLLPDSQLFIDLSWRIRLNQMTVAVHPLAFAWRIQAHTQEKKRTQEQLFTHRLREKNDHWMNGIRHLPWIIGGMGIRFFSLLFSPSMMRDWIQDRITPRAVKQKRVAQKIIRLQTIESIRSVFSR